MTNPHRPPDPFANIVTLATDQKLFTDTRNPSQEPMQQDTQSRELSRDVPREKPRSVSSEKPREDKREKTRQLPSRDEIQEFSFRLRDELKVKVQAEVPAAWQRELEDLAHHLDVGKLELYRYILGAFLGKVERKDTD